MLIFIFFVCWFGCEIFIFFFVYTFRSHYPCSIFCLEEVPKTSRDYPWECWQVLHYSTLAEILLGIWLVAREPQWWEVPMTWVLHYLLGVAPSQDASGKWRFRLGFPTRKYYNPGGHCYWEEAIPKLYQIIFISCSCWVWLLMEEILHHRLDGAKTLQIMGINYQPQLVIAGFHVSSDPRSAFWCLGDRSCLASCDLGATRLMFQTGGLTPCKLT